MTDHLESSPTDQVLADAAFLLLEAPFATWLAHGYLRGQIVGALMNMVQADMQAGLGVPDWRHITIEPDEEAALMAGLRVKLLALGELVEDDPSHPGRPLDLVAEQLGRDIVLLAARPSGVRFAGALWKVRADGTSVEVFEGEHRLLRFAPQDAPGLVVPERKLHVPGQR